MHVCPIEFETPYIQEIIFLLQVEKQFLCTNLIFIHKRIGKQSTQSLGQFFSRQRFTNKITSTLFFYKPYKFRHSRFHTSFPPFGTHFGCQGNHRNRRQSFRIPHLLNSLGRIQPVHFGLNPLLPPPKHPLPYANP
jgi:hypothetical protein